MRFKVAVEKPGRDEDAPQHEVHRLAERVAFIQMSRGDGKEVGHRLIVHRSTKGPWQKPHQHRLDDIDIGLAIVTPADDRLPSHGSSRIPRALDRL